MLFQLTQSSSGPPWGRGKGVIKSQLSNFFFLIFLSTFGQGLIFLFFFLIGLFLMALVASICFEGQLGGICVYRTPNIWGYGAKGLCVKVLNNMIFCS